MNTFDWIGFAGLLVALAGWLYTWYVDRKVKTQEIALNDLQIKKYKEEAESKKAIIEANVYRTPPTRSRVSGWRMKIYNKGKSTAKNIRIESEDIEKIDSHIKLYIPDELLPYPLLHPQTSFEIVMIVNSGHDRMPKIKFIWDDDYGRNQEREQILSL
jgi:hypothetical protein